MKRSVYNLEFMPWHTEMTISGYRFVRVPEYGDRLKGLFRISPQTSEFQIQPNTGGHAITAEVEFQTPEKKPVLDWDGDGHTALNDICLLLSLFTRRDVFAIRDEDRNGTIVRDLRFYY